MNNIYKVTLLFISTVIFAGCSNENSDTEIYNEKTEDSIYSNVEKNLSLKDFFIGMDIKKIKKTNKISDKSYIFESDYFGSKRDFRVSTNEKGEIYKYDVILDGSFDMLKGALEEKLTAENGKSVKFKCATSITKPDKSAEIVIQECKIFGKSEILKIQETKIQPTEKIYGLDKLPTVVISIELEGTTLSAEVRNSEENLRKKIEKEKDLLRKKDL